MLGMIPVIMREINNQMHEYDILPLKRLLSHEQLDPEYPDIGLTIPEDDTDIALLQDIQFKISSLYSVKANTFKSDEAFKLAMHAQRMWTAAIQIVYRWQGYACVPILRTSLESINYALLISLDSRKGEAWKNRHNGEQGKKDNKKAFKQPMADARIVLNAKDNNLGEWIYYIYQGLIDDGAHPNPRGVFAANKVYAQNSEVFYGSRMKCQYSIFSLITKGAIINCLQVGMSIYRISLEILGSTNTETMSYFNSLQLELRQRMDEYNERINPV